jgi:pyrroloquinoline quinone (PQQ) biosynthesis protein C
MKAYQQLSQLTLAGREYLHAAPVIAQALAGRVTRELYLAFLSQAYHHVRHTVPLMMGVGLRLDQQQQWLRNEIVEYVKEETGHEQWILNDIEAAGGDRQAVEKSHPSIETDAMIAYAYDTVMRRNPVGFFGMVFVLEGTSVALALHAADRIQSSLELPNAAFSYLRSHGTLDQEHIHHLASILERLDTNEEFPAVVQCAHAIFRLYGNLFRGLERTPACA